MASIILQLKSLIPLFSGHVGKREVVMESGHIPMEPLKLQGAARVQCRAQGQGLSWHKEMPPAAQAQSQGLSESSSPGTALSRPFWKH